MTTQPVKYVATASFALLNNADLPVNQWIAVDVHPEKIPIEWQGAAPDGRSSDFLDATFVQGYQVSYDIDYYLSGYIYVDSGSAQFVEHTTDVNGNDAPPNTLVPNKGNGLWYYWTYGTSDGGPRYRVPVGVVPRTIRYSIQRSGVNYIGHQMTWYVAITITVIRDCTLGNITDQICQDLCLGSLSQECYTNYNQYCLQEDPNRIATPTCRDFFTKWIAVKVSDNDIDKQARRYCSAKYDGFADLLIHSPKIPDVERINDIPICACNLVAKTGPDPGGTVLYSNYFKSLVAQFPGLAVYGASIQQKCLLPECASAAFKPATVGPGGCTVPQCINLISITNDGTINGDIVIDQSAVCQQSTGGDGGLTIATVVIIVLVVLLVIFIIVYFFMTPGSHRFVPNTSASNRKNETSGNTNIGTGISRSAS